MTATLIPNNMPQYPFGTQTNQAIGRLVSLNTTLARLGEAIQTATSGYDGVPGTQFEAAPTMTTPMPGPTGAMTPPRGGPQPAPMSLAQGQNLFGITPDPAQPGVQGQAYAYAMERLTEEWTKFWTAAVPFIQQLDNGQTTI